MQKELDSKARIVSPWRNRLGFGLGTVGRDMAVTMVTMYLMFYVTDVLRVTDSTLAIITTIIVVMRIFDGVNDPFMGTLVDNTKSRWGKFKPWMFGGALIWSIFHVFMFVDTGLKGAAYAVVFTIVYLGWEVSFTANDISFWSMIPALSRSQKEREKIGSIARICASVGMFALVVAIVPVTNAIGEQVGSLQRAWLILAVVVAIIMLAFQAITLIFAKEETVVLADAEKTKFSDLFRLIFRNDQLLVITVAMLMFMGGYTLTTSLGIYYFKYVYGDENMYAIFAMVLGISQILGLTIFPFLTKRLKRAQVFNLGIGLVVLGYIGFYFAPMDMLFIGIAGILIFVGQSFIQLLMLLYIADAVEYGQWKFGRRNESVTFSLQPLIYKVSNAMANTLLGISLFAANIQGSESSQDLTSRDADVLKIFMMLIPVVLILICFAVMKRFYKIDEVFYEKIVADNIEAERKWIDAN